MQEHTPSPHLFRRRVFRSPLVGIATYSWQVDLVPARVFLTRTAKSQFGGVSARRFFAIRSFQVEQRSALRREAQIHGGPLAVRAPPA